MAREELMEMTRSLVSHGKAGTMELADDVISIPVADYIDETRFEREVDRIFKRLPLMLAPSCELPEPGSYKAMEVAGIPILLTRDKDGVARAFLNSCTHRGNPVAEGKGTAPRFTCGYHGWTFRNNGDLLAVASPKDFGDIDKAAHCLKSFPLLERAGLIWVTLDPNSTLDIEDYLCGYDNLLANFGFENWHLFESRTLTGPNWKTAYDGYLDFYHLPVLHANTFGADFYNRANYFAWGPHQRLSAPTTKVKLPDQDDEIDLSEIPESDWPDYALMTGVWTIFPHISIASFDGGGKRGAMISQLFPGDSVGESFTTQFYVMENKPDDPEIIKGAHEQFAFLETVVADEDYKTGKRQHRALQADMMDSVLFGRNEGGGQAFHQWVHRLVEADDAELAKIFS
jgi:phenylpropionate dioxygenase-like ring-hydroxylating dioxygenase large terminal subunit